MKNKTCFDKEVCENFFMEDMLQWMQVKRQQLINLQFNHTSQYSKGELATFNQVKRKVDQILLKRTEQLHDVIKK